MNRSVPESLTPEFSLSTIAIPVQFPHLVPDGPCPSPRFHAQVPKDLAQGSSRLWPMGNAPVESTQERSNIRGLQRSPNQALSCFVRQTQSSI